MNLYDMVKDMKGFPLEAKEVDDYDDVHNFCHDQFIDFLKSVKLDNWEIFIQAYDSIGDVINRDVIEDLSIKIANTNIIGEVKT